MPKERTDRTASTRESVERKKEWTPPSILPTPNPVDGYVFRWVRTATMGNADNRNASMRFREGWEPVKAEDHPELMLQSDINSQFSGNIEVGGLLLCRTTKELMDQRDEFHRSKAATQMEGVDQNFMKQSDSRMPLFTESDSRVSFGKGGPKR
tara:strand:+ start:815 stop:1273 length:459 start_codon:yes stop_codon:yes gene_type:complete